MGKAVGVGKVLLRDTTMAFAYLAFWQLAVFVMMLLMVWVNEVWDMSALLFGRPKSPPDLWRGCLASAGILIGAIVTVGNTYLQQRRIVSGLLTICSYCKKIRICSDAWQRIEDYLGHHSEVELTHGVCPTCYPVVQAAVEKEGQGGAGSGRLVPAPGRA